MNSSNKNEQKLQEALRAAYVHKEKIDIELSSRWQMDVMRDIRRLGPLNEKINPFVFFDRVVWRFATAACAVALILSVYVGFTGWNPTDEVANLFFDDPVEFTLSQVIGDY